MPSEIVTAVRSRHSVDRFIGDTLWIVNAGLIVTLVFSLFPLLGIDWFLIDIFSSFRAQYAAGGVFCMALFAGLRRRRSFVLSAVVVFLNLFAILPLYFSNTATLGKSAEGLSLLLANVYTANALHSEVITQIINEEADILILQEVDLAWETSLASLRGQYPHVVSIPRSDNFGISVFSKFPFFRVEEGSLSIDQPPVVFVEVEIAEAKYSILAGHPVPPGSPSMFALRNTQLEMMAEKIAGSSGHKILVGDLNVTPWSSIFQKLLSSSGLIDARKGFGILPTWPVQIPVFYIPIDHFLVSSSLIVSEFRVVSIPGSDHKGLLVALFPRPPSEFVKLDNKFSPNGSSLNFAWPL